jgi:hypothetical protein
MRATLAPQEPLAGSLRPPALRKPHARPLRPLAPQEPPATLHPPSAVGPHRSKPQKGLLLVLEGRSALQTKILIKYIK